MASGDVSANTPNTNRTKKRDKNAPMTTECQVKYKDVSRMPRQISIGAAGNNERFGMLVSQTPRIQRMAKSIEQWTFNDLGIEPSLTGHNK